MNKRYTNDRFSIFSSNEHEIRNLSKRLNYSVDEILAAVQEVGFNEEEIEEYIQDRNNRG
jgi:hypothetical protein